MGFWSRLFGREEKSVETSGSSAPAGWLVGALGGGTGTITGKKIGPGAALCCSVVFACTKIISEDAAKLDLQVWKKRDDGGRDLATRHFLTRLLRRPNRWQNRFEFVEFLMFCLLLRGNAVCVIRRNVRGEPVELIPINPDRITILEAYDGTFFYQITRSGFHQTAMLEGLPLAVPDDDVLHIRNLSADGIVGLSPISLGREAIAQSLVMEEYSSRLFSTGARPGGILRVKGKLSPEVAARMKASWEAAHGGLGKVGGTAVLEEDTDWKPLGMTSVDAQFIDSRRHQIEEIARLFRMPLHKINSMEQSTKNNISQQSLEYLTDTLQPWLERIETALEWKFDLDVGNTIYSVEFDVSKLVRADLKTRYDAYAVAKSSGWMSTNEIRVKEGLNPVPHGDEIMTPMNMVPLGTDLAKLAAGPANKEPVSPRTNVDSDSKDNE